MAMEVGMKTVNGSQAFMGSYALAAASRVDGARTVKQRYALNPGASPAPTAAAPQP